MLGLLPLTLEQNGKEEDPRKTEKPIPYGLKVQPVSLYGLSL